MAINLGDLFLDGEQFPLVDSSGNGCSLTDAGIPIATAQKKHGNSSMYFDKTKTLSGPSDPFGTANFTIDFWVRFDDVAAGAQFFVLQYAAANQRFIFYLNGVGGPLYFAIQNTAWLPCSASHTPMVDNQWYHLAVTRNGATFKTYIDGSMIATASHPSANASFTAPLNIGHYNGAPSFKGHMDNFRVTRGEALWLTDFDVNDNDAMFYGAANEPPVANPDSVTLDENTSTVIDLLANDTDPELQPLTVTALTDPDHGVLVDHGDGTVTYTPTPEYFGLDSFDYTIEDNLGAEDTSTASITITKVDANPNRPDNMSSLYNMKQNSLRGKAAEGFIRPTITQFFCADPSKKFESIISNYAPVANTDSAEVDYNSSVIIDLLANDTDVDDDPLTIISITEPAHGTIEDHEDGTVTYTPDLNYSGSDTFDYTISDGEGGVDSATSNITINPKPFFSGPGPGEESLQYDETTETGYYGEVTTNDLCTGSWLASQIGLTTGTAINDTANWLKFKSHGKALFIPKTTLRHTVSWDQIYLLGAVFGTTDYGAAYSSTEATALQNATVTIDDNEYKVRLITGAEADTVSADTHLHPDCSDNGGGGSEWNELIYRVHANVPACPGTTHGGPQIGANWANFSDAEMGINGSNGKQKMTSSTYTGVASIVTRGESNLTTFQDRSKQQALSDRGWFPVLELITLPESFTLDKCTVPANASVNHASTGSAAGVFDGVKTGVFNSASVWRSVNTVTSWWLKYDFGAGNEQRIEKYTLTSINDASRYSTQSPKAWIFQGSSDDTNWVDLDTQIDQTWSIMQTREFIFENLNSYRYYRWSISETLAGGNDLLLAEAEMMEGIY